MRSLCTGTAADKLEAKQEIQALIEAEELAAAFEPMERETYWGYYQSTNRSSNAGRTQSIDARLDACMSYTNWDPSNPYTTCVSTCNDGSKNLYCAANSNDVCLDRCECKYSQPGCNNL